MPHLRYSYSFRENLTFSSYVSFCLPEEVSYVASSRAYKIDPYCQMNVLSGHEMMYLK